MWEVLTELMEEPGNALGKLVIPALIDGASMPTREALPYRMASLADRHAIPIGDSRFEYEVERLIGAIGKVIRPHHGAGVESRITRSELRNRRDLLNYVKGEVENRLKQSLHSAVLIDLQKEKQPQQVSRTGDPERESQIPTDGQENHLRFKLPPFE